MQPACLVWTIIRDHVSSTGACERPWSMSDVCGRCLEVALGEGRRSPYHLGRRRDTGQPGETIAIPIKPGEQSSLALPPGEGHAPIMDMPLPHACSEPLSSPCETGRVARCRLRPPAPRQSLPPHPRAGGPAAVCLRPPRPCPRRQLRAAWFLPPQHREDREAQASRSVLRVE